MKHPLSIKFKLTLWYLFFLIVVLLFFGSLSYRILNKEVYHTNNDQLNSTVVSVKEPDFDSNSLTSETSQSGSTDENYRFLSTYSIDKEQLSKIRSGDVGQLPVSTPQGMILIDQQAFITPDMDNSQEIWLYYRQSISQPGYLEILVITQSKTGMVNMIAAYKNILLIAIPATIILAGCLGYFLVKQVLKPVERITQVAREIQEKDLTRRIEIKNNDELGKLSATLNQAFDSLQKSLERERQFINDASHELQTPLSIVKNTATLALTGERSNEEYKKALGSISQETSFIFSTVNKLLTLARADSGTEKPNFAEVNLERLLEDVAADIRVLAENKGINFQTAWGENLVVTGDELRLRELFLNLLGNAIKFTPSGGNITLSMVKQDRTARVTIEDTGIGIAEENLPHIFERFYRVNKTDDEGSGLGLAIAKHIAELHHGKIEVKSKIGEGSTFTIILPLANK